MKREKVKKKRILQHTVYVCKQRSWGDSFKLHHRDHGLDENQDDDEDDDDYRSCCSLLDGDLGKMKWTIYGFWWRNFDVEDIFGMSALDENEER